MGHGKIFENLGRKYAKRFVKEHPARDISERQLFFIAEMEHARIASFNSEGLFGPREIWPISREDLSNIVISNYSRSQIDYQRLQEILLSERPTILTRSYNSQKEYETVIAMNFGTILEGIYAGKLKRIGERKIDEMRRSSLIRRFYKKETIVREALKDPQIARRADFYESDISREN